MRRRPRNIGIARNYIEFVFPRGSGAGRHDAGEAMGTRTVFCFYYYDRRTRARIHSPFAATIDTIEKLDGVPLKESALEVDESDVDSHGFLRGPPHCGDRAHGPRRLPPS